MGVIVGYPTNLAITRCDELTLGSKVNQNSTEQHKGSLVLHQDPQCSPDPSLPSFWEGNVCY